LTCSKTSDPVEFFCEPCYTSGHASRLNRGHDGGPLDVISAKIAFSECPKHKMPEDIFCFDENVFICKQCCEDDHKPPHRTKLVVEHEEETKQGLMSSLSFLNSSLDTEHDNLETSKKQKLDEIKEFEQKIESIKEEIEGINSKIKTVKKKSEKGKSATHFLTKAIEDFSREDFFDQDKIESIKRRVKNTLASLDIVDVVTFLPILKSNYGFKFKFGIQGTQQGHLSHPYAMTLDREGLIFIADTYNGRIQVFQPDGTWIRSFGLAERNHFFPAALCFHPDGSLIVIDEQEVLIFENDVLKYSFANGELKEARGVAVTCEGNIIVSDGGADVIKIYSITGELLKSFGSHGTALGQFHTPRGVAVDHKNNIIIVDRMNNRIQIFDSEGISIRAFGSKVDFCCPWGVAVDQRGDIVVADDDGGRIQIYSNEGQFLMSFGEPGKDNGQFSSPMTPVIDQEGNILVVDYENCNVQVFG